MNRNRPKALAAACLWLAILLALLASVGGCFEGLQEAAGVKSVGELSLQQQLDAEREGFSLALDIVTPLVTSNVIRDAATLGVIRTATKQVAADIKAGQANIDAGRTSSAEFLIERIRAVVRTLYRIEARAKGKPPPGGP